MSHQAKCFWSAVSVQNLGRSRVNVWEVDGREGASETGVDGGESASKEGALGLPEYRA